MTPTTRPRYEYTYVWLHDATTLDDPLNPMARDGWRLVAVVPPTERGAAPMLILERELPQKRTK